MFIFKMDSVTLNLFLGSYRKLFALVRIAKISTVQVESKIFIMNSNHKRQNTNKHSVSIASKHMVKPSDLCQ